MDWDVQDMTEKQARQRKGSRTKAEKQIFQGQAEEGIPEKKKKKVGKEQPG